MLKTIPNQYYTRRETKQLICNAKNIDWFCCEWNIRPEEVNL